MAFLIDDWAEPPKIIAPTNSGISVADGDSFALGGQKIRLDGVDAPEYRQTCSNQIADRWECGKAARGALDQLLRQPGLNCHSDAHDQYGRLIAICSTSSTRDIGAAQVVAGLAVSQEYFGARAYPDEEDIAKELKRGIWAGAFISPSEWRETSSRSTP